MFEPLEHLIEEADARCQEGGEAVARGSDEEECREYVLHSTFDTMPGT
jgi:hypothetical protein